MAVGRDYTSVKIGPVMVPKCQKKIKDWDNFENQNNVIPK